MSTSPDASPTPEPVSPGNILARRRRARTARQERRPAPSPLGAARSGALWATIAAWSAVLWLGAHELVLEGSDHHDWWITRSITGLIVVLVIASVLHLVHGIADGSEGKSRRTDVTLLSTAAIIIGAGVIIFLVPWWQSYSYDGRAEPLSSLIIVTLLLQGTRWILSIIQRIQDGLDAASADRGATDEPPRISSAPRARRAWTRAVASFLAPASMVALITCGAFAALPSPDLAVHAEQTLAAAPDADLPGVPSGAPTQVAWSLDITAYRTQASVAAGARGPIVVSDDGIQGIDGENGSILWTYRATNGTYMHADDDPEFQRRYQEIPQIITSPDHRHIAVIMETTDADFEGASCIYVLVLDASTGQVTVEHPVSRTPLLVQMTDSAALIENQVLSLENGTQIGTIDPRLTDSNHARDISGTASHSAFILPSGADNFSQIDLLAIPTSDLTAETPLGNACPIERARRWAQVTQDGWTAICETDDAPTNDGLRAISALNVDEAAHSGDAGAARRISLGRATGVNRKASTAAEALITTNVAWDSVDRTTLTPAVDNPWAGVVFDPRTQAVTPAKQSTSIGAALFHDTVPEYGSPIEERAFNVTLADGSTPLSIPISTADSFIAAGTEGDPPRPKIDVLADRSDFGDPQDIRAAVSPGAITLMTPTYVGGPRSEGRNFRIYGVR